MLMSKHKEWLMVGALILSMIFQPINSTMISVALTPIADSLDVGTLAVSWVVTIYLIVNAASQPVSGKLGDMYGYRKIFSIGIILFLIGSVGGALSPNLTGLIVFRGFQALGTSMLLPNATALMRNIVAPERLARTLGLFAMMVTLGSAVGPLLGSFLISIWDWHAIFWVNVPFLLIGLVSIFFLPKVEHAGRSSLDLSGSLYLASGLTFLVLATNGFSLIWTIVFLFGVVLFALLFIRREKTARHPLIPFSLFQNRTFSISNILVIGVGFIMYSMMLSTPMILEKTGNAIAQVGTIMLAFSLSMSVFSAVGGRLTEWIGQKNAVLLSFAFSSLAMVGYLGMTAIDASWYQIIVLIFAGIGVGIGMPAIQTSALQSIRADMAGIVTGVFSTSRYIGQVAASTLIGFLAASPVMFVIVLVISFIGLIISMGIPKENGSMTANENVSS